MAGLLTATVIARQQTKPMTGHDMPMSGGMSMMTKAQKISNAVAAAPTTVSAKATVVDWPTKEGAKPEVLRAGSNGWTCLPDMPETKGNDPMCVDETWLKWVDAYVARKSAGDHQRRYRLHARCRRRVGEQYRSLCHEGDAGQPLGTSPAAHHDSRARREKPGWHLDRIPHNGGPVRHVERHAGDVHIMAPTMAAAMGKTAR